MLSLFPTLLAYQLLAPLLIRLTLGAVLVFWGYRGIRAKSDVQTTSLGILDAVVGLLLIVGFLTQLAAVIAAVILLAKIVSKGFSKALFTNGVNYYFILFVMALSLILTGAGFLAFDL